MLKSDTIESSDLIIDMVCFMLRKSLQVNGLIKVGGDPLDTLTVFIKFFVDSPWVRLQSRDLGQLK